MIKPYYSYLHFTLAELKLIVKIFRWLISTLVFSGNRQKNMRLELFNYQTVIIYTENSNYQKTFKLICYRIVINFIGIDFINN